MFVSMRVCAWGPPSRLAMFDDHLTWCRVQVQGRPAAYGLGGSDGPPVVFLHGWALGSRAYKRAIKRLTTRGCQVYAPAMPSFGGTADLPSADRNLDGYARWVADFMAAVGIDEPALLIGHSFGGGVAIKLAHLQPDLVRYLVLLNAVGSVAPRPPWEWLGGFAREFWPLPQAVEMVQAVGADVVPNLIRNPVGLVRVARLAQLADLRGESADLRASNTPVLVLTSEGDSVIPRDAFETLCDAVGTNGRVVSGRHCWLLADPDSFGEAMAAVVDVQVAVHNTSRAATRAEEVLALLKKTNLSGRSARALVDSAPPLWLMSESAGVLAGDLALCHPKLRPGEVRAVARTMEGSDSVRLTIVAADRRGLLADSASVLASSKLSITNASAATWPRLNLALHSFVVEGGGRLRDSEWEELGERLRAMGSCGSAPIPLNSSSRSARITVQGGAGGDRSIVTITQRDHLGLLSSLCRAFSALGANIESLHARTVDGIARDMFLVVGDVDAESLRRLLDKGRPSRSYSAQDLHPSGVLRSAPVLSEN
jgi:pimeloyl-ACP methyl ester carboxylesterase/predicted amino acid-binding ACT domain protein